MAWEEKIATLERQVKELQLTVTKYDDWFRDQRMFCDCVAKYFKRQFGFDIWLQLDMLRSALGMDSSDSDEGTSSSFFAPLNSSSRKRSRFDYRAKAPRVAQAYPSPRTNESGPSDFSMPRSLSAKRTTTTEAHRTPVPTTIPQSGRSSNNGTSSYVRRVTPEAAETAATSSASSRAAIIPGISTVSQAEKSPEVSELTGDSAQDSNSHAGETSGSQGPVISRGQGFSSPRAFSAPDGHIRDSHQLIKAESSEDYIEEIIPVDSETEQFVYGSGLVMPAPPSYGNAAEIFNRHKRGHSKKHSVWNYYEILGNRAKCLVRGCDVEVKGVYPTNVLNHLKRHHPHVYDEVMHEEWVRKNAPNLRDLRDHRDPGDHHGLDDPLA